MPGSLVFGALTSDVVDMGTPASLNNMTQFTFCGYFMPTTLTSGRGLVSKRIGVGSLGWMLQLNGTSGGMRFAWGRVTTAVVYDTLTTPLTLNQWTGVCLVADSVTPSYNIYTWSAGVLSTATFSTTTNGAGAFNSDATVTFKVGNGGAASPTAAFQGFIGPSAIFPGLLFSTASAQSWFLRPRVTLTAGAAGGMWRLGNEGTGSQQDYSGHTIPGTVTGATQGDGPPLNQTIPSTIVQRAA